MWSKLKTALTSILLFIALCFGANAAVTENHALGNFLAAQHYIDENPEANQLASLESFGFYQKHASECCNAPNNVELPYGYRVLNDGINSNRVDPPSGYRWVTDDGTPQLQSTTSGRIYASVDDVPTPTGNFSGTYQANPKHDVTRPGVSPQPTNGADALANSVPIGGNSTGRIAYDQSTGEIVVFQNHLGNAFHGYVPSSFNALPQAQRNALIRAGLFTAKGRPIR